MKIINKDQLSSYISEIKKENEECFNLRKTRRELWIQAMSNYNNYDKVPFAYSSAWLENCDQRIIKWVSDLSKQYENGIPDEPKGEKEGLYIYGNCGTGKTYTLYSIYRNYCLNNERCRIINTVELLRLFKLDFKGDSNNFEWYLHYDGVLFIDDIGAEKNSEFVDETLYHLINTRSENELPTFFTSNLSLKELAEKNGDRIASRIAGMCEVIKLEGEDQRIKK